MTSTELRNEFKRSIYWPTVLYYIYIHAFGLYGFILLLTQAKWMTVFFTLLVILISALGITIGAHRLWAHRAFEASGIVRGALMLAHTLSGSGSIYDWVLAHRTHHKYYGTERDPYNHKKGFFFSHLQSNLLSSHPDQEKLDKDINMCDVDADGYLQIQRWLYWILFPMVGLLLPINVPVEYWDESLLNSIFIVGFLRLAILAHVVWLVNSAALVWGLKPGDKFPANDNSIFFVQKSYWPNFHYYLPWDWKCGEFGSYDRGCSTFFLRMLKNLGLVDSMRTASSDTIYRKLAQVASKETDLVEALEAIKQDAEEEAVKVKLRYQH